MELLLAIVSALFACAMFVVNWLFNKPKEEETKALRDTVGELKEVVEILRDHAIDNKVEIAKIDASVKSAHKRIDFVAGQVHELETRCIHCTCRVKE